jgi:DNA-binding GntR family transcriptional regulator
MTRPPSDIALEGEPARKSAIRPAASSVTLAERLRMQLADEIVRGELVPGIALDETVLAQRFEVSRTPVREAIRLLAASGLVEARPHRSAVVARPDRSQLIAMFEALCELEMICAGLAAERMTKAEQGQLKQLHNALRQAVRRGEPLAYYQFNIDFHSAIYAGSHNAYIEKITTETRARIAPFSRAQFTTFGRLEKSYTEHDAVVSAILAGDRAAAANAMRIHIETVHATYLTFMRGGSAAVMPSPG